eukprot:5763008-Amphidinium_carterae.2
MAVYKLLDPTRKRTRTKSRQRLLHDTIRPQAAFRCISNSAPSWGSASAWLSCTSHCGEAITAYKCHLAHVNLITRWPFTGYSQRFRSKGLGSTAPHHGWIEP